MWYNNSVRRGALLLVGGPASRTRGVVHPLAGVLPPSRVYFENRIQATATRAPCLREEVFHVKHVSGASLSPVGNPILMLILQRAVRIGESNPDSAPRECRIARIATEKSLKIKTKHVYTWAHCARVAPRKNIKKEGTKMYYLKFYVHCNGWASGGYENVQYFETQKKR